MTKVNELTRCAYEAPVVFIVCYDKSKAWVSPFDIPDNLTPSFLLDIGYPLKGTAPSKMHFEKREVKDFTTYR